MSTTEKLLDAAEYRMRRGGYNAVSFRDLAADTNIKSASVHYHYPKKEDLGHALVARYAERFFGNLSEMAPESARPKEKLEAFRLLYRQALTADGATCLCGLLGSELAGLPERLADSIRAFFWDNIDFVVDALPEGFSKAEKDRAASSLVAGFQGALMLATTMHNDVELFDSITENLVALILKER